MRLLTSRRRYYEGGVSSVYLWTPEDTKDQFAGVVLLKKGEFDVPFPSSSPPSLHFMPHSLVKTFFEA